MKLDSRRSRIRAALVNSGQYSFAQADRYLASSVVEIFLPEEVAHTPAGQAAFVTAIVAATRCFGRVTIGGYLEFPLILPIPVIGSTLQEVAMNLGCAFAGEHTRHRIVIGDGTASGESTICTWWDGWSAGTVPPTAGRGVGDGSCVLAGIAAGALAVGQVFLAEQGDMRGCREAQAISLWTPGDASSPWENSGPREFCVPSSLWLFGLGNLGQSYLWSLLMLTLADAQQLTVYLQDDDELENDNWGTSILAERDQIGILKTRLCEQWLERRGFRARRVDRRLDEHLHRTEREPLIALAGFDNMESRRMLGNPGFDFVVDAGLGSTARDYHKFRINTFDASGDPATHYSMPTGSDRAVAELLKLPAYAELADAQDDGGCGAAVLAGKAVAVPFVSAFVGALVVAQTARIASGEAPCATLTGECGSLRTIRAAPGVRPAPGTIPFVTSAGK